MAGDVTTVTLEDGTTLRMSPLVPADRAAI